MEFELKGRFDECLSEEQKKQGWAIHDYSPDYIEVKTPLGNTFNNGIELFADEVTSSGLSEGMNRRIVQELIDSGIILDCIKSRILFDE